MSQAKGAASAPLSLSATLTFACCYLPFSALNTSVAVQVPNYFARHIGLGLAVGGVFGLIRLIDIPLDPFLGLVMDRTRTPLGRYRPWMMLGAPVLMLAIYMMYEAPVGASRGYLLLWLLIMYLGMSLLLLAANAWAATLAVSYTHRSRIFGAMQGLGTLGAIAILVIPIITHGMHRTDAQGIQAVGWFLVVMAPVTIALVTLRTPEPLTKVEASRVRLSDYAELLARPNVLRLIAADFFIIMGPAWMSALYLFFFTDSRGFSLSAANGLLVIYIAAGLFGAPATAWLANRISKHRALAVTAVGYSLMLIVIFLSPKASFAIAAPAMFMAGALAAGSVVMIRSLTADIGDEIRLEQGQHQIGLLYALTSGTTKAAGALAVTLTFWVLSLVGYNPAEHATNGAAQIRGLELAYAIGPIVFVMIGGACFLGYKLSAERHADIRRRLDERDAVYAESPVVQSLAPSPSETLVTGP
ncbi:MFS transporter [Phenylobacterium sp.]|uniref:MFS transporter n=1 Tax=Phenylobacterium sp. TaxID=1871053 RepID=UPI002E33401D|nr:MFS transporter [Phenylobacterium sp.]HEX3363458.1 MFS transporter [Phenylobacterium sp.]